jgi:hypothetical protein
LESFIGLLGDVIIGTHCSWPLPMDNFLPSSGWVCESFTLLLNSSFWLSEHLNHLLIWLIVGFLL